MKPSTLDNVEAALRAGNIATAAPLIQRYCEQTDDPGPRALILLATVAQAQRQFDDAAAAFARAAAQSAQPAEQAHLFNMAAQAICAKDAPATGDIDRVIDHLEQSVARVPGIANADARLALCEWHHRRGDYRDVVRHAETLAGSPHAIKAGFLLARACFHIDRRDQGSAALAAIQAQIQTLDKTDFLMLLQLLMRYQDFRQAESAMHAASATQKDHHWIREFTAQILCERGEYEAATQMLTPRSIESCNDPDSQRNMYQVRGRALDALGRHADAFASFTAMNRIAASSWKSPETSDMVAAWSRVALDELPVTQDHPDGRYEPAFMVGFPRSGTTLLETVLATQAGIHALGEFGAVYAAIHAVSALGYQYPEDLNALTGPDLERARDAYYAHNAKYVDLTGTDKLVIDKLPTNILHIPFIETLFPGARFICSVRHPADTCLSCFQQDFGLNEEMIHFTDIERCFKRFRDVMTLLERFQATQRFAIHAVRYEDLVTDLQPTVLDVFRFLGHEPDNAFENFHAVAEKKVTRTPSNRQVNKPLYDSSRNKWKNYAVQLQPYLDIVRPFAERYGYTL